MGSFTNINTYAQQTLTFTDNRTPGLRIFPPVPVDTVYDISSDPYDPIQLYMGTTVEEVIRPDDADGFLTIQTNQASNAIVEWDNLPTGVNLIPITTGYYLLAPIASPQAWEQIATGGTVTFPQGADGDQIVKLELNWFAGDEFIVKTWYNGTRIPFAFIRPAFTLLSDVNVIFAPRYDWTSEADMFATMGFRRFGVVSMPMVASVTAVRNRIRGYTFARSAVFTQITKAGLRKEFSSLQTVSAASQIIPLRIKKSPVSVTSIIQVGALGGFKLLGESQMQSNASFVCNGVSTTIVEFESDVTATTAINIEGVSTRIRLFEADFAPTTTETTINGRRLAGINSNPISTFATITNAKRYASLVTNPTIVSTVVGQLSPIRLELEWLSSSTNTQRTFSVQLLGNTTIDWGNQLVVTLSSGTYNLVSPPGSGTRTIVDSVAPMRFFNPSTSLSKVLSWPNQGFTTLKDMFKGASNLTEVYNYPIKVSGTTVDASYMFQNAKIASELSEIMNFVGNRLSNTSYMFEGATSFNKNIGNWNVSNVTDMSFMFKNATNFNNGGNSSISNWNTGNVTNMASMFYQSNIDQPLNNWDTSKVTDMSWMFFSAGPSSNIPQWNFSTWNTAAVTDMSNMFRSTKIHSSNGVQNWNTSNVTTMKNMFASTTLFSTSLNTWNTSKVTDLSYMFDQSYFNGDIGAWDTSSVTNMSYMFRYAQNFNKNIGTWNTSNVTDMRNMFDHGYNSSGTYPFNNGGSPSINNWNTSKVRNMSSMFRGSANFNQPIGNWNTSAVNHMNEMFAGASSFNQSLTRVGNQWNTGSVGNMDRMFFGASSFNQNLSNWCVTFVFSEPDFFAGGATAWTLPKPVWGTCPA